MSERIPVRVRYSRPPAEPVVLELYGDPFEVCRRVAEKLDLTIIKLDLGADAVMRERLVREKKAA